MIPVSKSFVASCVAMRHFPFSGTAHALIDRLHVLVFHRDVRRSDCGTGSGVLVKDPSPDPLPVRAVSSLCFWIAFDAVVASHHEMLMLIAVT